MPTFRPMTSELFTDRLHLRPWRAADAEPHRQLWTERDRRSLRLIDAEGRPTVDDLRERMAEHSDDAERSLRLFAVERLAGADFIGYCGLIVGQASAEEPEIAYEFARRVHGNGYATEAAGIVVAEAAATGRSRLGPRCGSRAAGSSKPPTQARLAEVVLPACDLDVVHDARRHQPRKPLLPQRDVHVCDRPSVGRYGSTEAKVHLASVPVPRQSSAEAREAVTLAAGVAKVVRRCRPTR
jgi:RimJ/RimL family protein N-acetyltransferase